MTFMDKLKSKAEELDLQGKADRLADAASKAAQQAKEKAGELADENRDKVAGVLDKAGAAIDERTEGKYAAKVARGQAAGQQGCRQTRGATPQPRRKAAEGYRPSDLRLPMLAV